MKRAMLIILLILVGCTAQAPEHGAQHTSAKIMKVHADKDELNLHDFNIKFARPTAEAGKETELKFTILQNGQPMELKLLHERLMHLILVRKDLNYFDHLHPEKKENGVFSIPYSFLAPGEYRLWVEFTDGVLEHIIDYPLTVGGTAELPEQDTLNGLNVEIQTSELQQDKPAKINFIVTKDDAPVQITETWLGADAHLIIISNTLNEFAHLHDAAGDSDNLLAFGYTPEYSGNYTSWVEFMHEKKTRTAKFGFTIHKT